MGDDETGSLWNHLTGRCVHGPLKGIQLELFPIEHTTAGVAASAHPGIRLARSSAPFWVTLLGRIMGKRIRKAGFLPPRFRRTMAPVDARLPEMASGLGIWEGHVRRFYPVEKLKEAGGIVTDRVGSWQVLVYLEPEGQTPHAVWWPEDRQPDQPPHGSGLERPMQMFTRWYGFSLTFPGCEIFGG